MAAPAPLLLVLAVLAGVVLIGLPKARLNDAPAVSCSSCDARHQSAAHVRARLAEESLP